MGKIYISEYGRQGLDVHAQTIAAPEEPPLATQVMTTSGTSQQSAPFNEKTNLIRVHTDGIVSISIGPDPTATLDSPRMAAGQTEYFSIRPGQGHELAGITNT